MPTDGAEADNAKCHFLGAVMEMVYFGQRVVT